MDEDFARNEAVKLEYDLTKAEERTRDLERLLAQTENERDGYQQDLVETEKELAETRKSVEGLVSRIEKLESGIEKAVGELDRVT